jgi:hypothetical protein
VKLGYSYWHFLKALLNQDRDVNYLQEIANPYIWPELVQHLFDADKSIHEKLSYYFYNDLKKDILIEFKFP